MSKKLSGKFFQAAVPVLFAVLLTVGVVPRAAADEWDKATKFTFSDSVQVPGKVLPPGTYWFRLLESDADRHIVEVYDETKQHLITTVLAIPNYRLQPRGKTVLTFEETAAAEPKPIKAWFYPGDNFGQEFVYKKGDLMASATTVTDTTQTAQAMPAPVTPTPVPDTTTDTTTTAPVQDTTPAPAMTTPAPVQDTTPAPAASTDNTSTDTTPDTLPKTASELPLLAAFGFSAFGLALAMETIRRRMAR